MDDQCGMAGVRRWCAALGLGMVALLAATRAGAVEPAWGVPEGWAPSLGDVAAHLDAAAREGDAQPQQALNALAQQQADVRDAALFIAYVRLAQSLGPTERATLAREQKKWLARREADARAAVVSRGGSMAPLEYATAFRQITERRLDVLSARLARRQAARQPQSP